jgi:glutathione-regulated potassium-efflux system ancillary protein KefG
MPTRRRVLVLFAHPDLARSRVNRRLLEAVSDLDGVTMHDLYEVYPDLDIDVAREQALLTDHDAVVLQHPFYWYSTPAILKQWQDLVLAHGWAYGRGGTALAGKLLLQVLTAGGSKASYRREGHNRFTIRELLAPVEQTARLCGMDYLPPYVVHGTHGLGSEAIREHAGRYRALMIALRDGALDLDAVRGAERLDGVLDAVIRR